MGVEWSAHSASTAQQHGRQHQKKNQNRNRNHTFRDLPVLDAVYIYLSIIRETLPDLLSSLLPFSLPSYMSDRGTASFLFIFSSFQLTVRSPAGMLGLTFLKCQPSCRLARLGRTNLAEFDPMIPYRVSRNGQKLN